MSPHQFSRFALNVVPYESQRRGQATLDWVSGKLRAILNGELSDQSTPPKLELGTSHPFKVESSVVLSSYLLILFRVIH